MSVNSAFLPRFAELPVILSDITHGTFFALRGRDLGER